MSTRLLPTPLHYADMVARLGSIQRTARELNVAASAINRHLLTLEAELGVRLFERLPRGMRPTPAGDAIIAVARRWRGDLHRVTNEIKDLQGSSQGRVRVAAMDSHANGLLPNLIVRLAAVQPAITLDVEIATTDRAAAALIDDQVDFAMAFNLPPHRDVRIIASEQLPFGCVVAPDHALVSQRSMTLQEVAAYPIVLQSPVLAIRRYLDARHSWLFSKQNPPVVTNSLQLLKTLVRTGRYVAFTSELDAVRELLDGTLKFIPVRDEGAEPQTASVAVTARKVSRITQIVAQMAAEEMRECLRRVRAL
jgi:DNA-binding transcriptional LysR family regulator